MRRSTDPLMQGAATCVEIGEQIDPQKKVNGISPRKTLQRHSECIGICGMVANEESDGNRSPANFVSAFAK